MLKKQILPSKGMPLSKVPEWVEKRAGFRPTRSTVFRWRTRGCRGRKLSTFRVGGRVCTTEEALLEFFKDDESDNPPMVAAGGCSAMQTATDAYLDAEGI